MDQEEKDRLQEIRWQYVSDARLRVAALWDDMAQNHDSKWTVEDAKNDFRLRLVGAMLDVALTEDETVRSGYVARVGAYQAILDGHAFSDPKGHGRAILFAALALGATEEAGTAKPIEEAMKVFLGAAKG